MNLLPKLFIVVAIFLIPTQVVSAHMFGQPPYFKVDDEYANLYPVPSSSKLDFNLPQDLAPANYLVNKEIDFELDTKVLPVSPETLSKTKFFWDFGDGNKTTGFHNTHTYTKIGSYILKIDIQASTDPEPVLLESVLVNVLPNKDYNLPQAVIKINSQKSADPLVDVIKIDLSKAILFDGSASYAQTKIVSYTWDLGDTQGSEKTMFNYRYASDLTQIFPVLRVRDENGFIGDNFVEIQNLKYLDDNLPQSTVSGSPKPTMSSPYDLRAYLGVGFLGVIVVILLKVFIFK